jgi:hypothetical protein
MRRRSASRPLDLGERGVVALFAGEVVERLGVVEPGRQAVVLLDVVGDGRQLARDPLGPLGLVPQVGARRLGLELGPSDSQLVELQVALGLVQPDAERLEIVGEVTHVRGWQPS